MANVKVKIFTGVRPTGDLTVANYLGAVEPIVALQKSGLQPMVFVADLHALTDYEPKIISKYINEVTADYLALGIDPEQTTIFAQSQIASQVTILTSLLARHISVAELLRVPTLKDKLKSSAKPETANTLLLLYPVMMAADILLQRAEKVPVGEDQLAHLEVARELARRFNDKYGDVFPIPKASQIRSLRILSLKGEGKMSKSHPEGAIFLTDDPKLAAQKIKKAQTASEGVLSDSLQSHIILAKGLSQNEQEKEQIDELIKKHMKGASVMGEFKEVFAKIVVNFLSQFQEKRAKIMKDPDYISRILDKGAKIAKENADETLAIALKAMGSNIKV